MNDTTQRCTIPEHAVARCYRTGVGFTCDACESKVAGS